ncbi:hypothetical protein MtrunA17_Chr6g0470611 [Medicago truncatula]|uniref:Uncharacterized protein n=1 Tax=Medicago truncatula TaxID=3880 RepID=A0A396HG93_MEDTR|nr:hypothetical protein MtrunA17_Chr6g0470611 [Medicago truncatula]
MDPFGTTINRTYKWLPNHEQDIKKAYHHKASHGYQNTMYRPRKQLRRTLIL